MDKVIIKNLTSLFLIQGASYLLPLITLPYLVSVLEPDGYGMLGFSFAFTQYFVLITQYGFDLSATNKIATYQNDKLKISEIFWSIIYCKISLATIGFVIINILILCSEAISSHKIIIFCTYIMILGNIFTPTWLFQGKESMGILAISNILSKTLVLPLIFIYVNSGDDVWLAALISSSGFIISAIISILLVYRSKWIIWVKPNFSSLKRVMIDGWYIFISGIASSMYINTIPVVLGFMAGPAAVGYYVAADKIRFALQGLLGPVSQTFYPRISSIININPNKGIDIIISLLKSVCSVSLIVSILLAYFAIDIVNLLYGSEYSESINILYILSPLIFIISVSNILAIQGMLTLGMKKQFSKIVWIGAIFNIVIISPLINYWGGVGAAMSVLSTEIIIMIIIVNQTKLIWFRNNKIMS